MAKKIIEKTTENHEEIAACAYQFYLQDGCVPGRDLDHWLRAEAHLRAERRKRAANPVESVKSVEPVKLSSRRKVAKTSDSRR
jgi:hypothetical protein